MPLLCGNLRLGPRSSVLQQLDRGRHADLLLLRQPGPPMAKRVCVFNFPFHMANITSMEYSVKRMMEVALWGQGVQRPVCGWCAA